VDQPEAAEVDQFPTGANTVEGCSSDGLFPQHDRRLWSRRGTDVGEVPLSSHSTKGIPEDEARYSVIGFSLMGRLLFVSSTPRGRMGEVIRIIHAHEAESDEERTYEEYN
jgi:uncharacterized DUF497 family protein